MKKFVILQLTALFALATFSLAATDVKPAAQPELRPTQKIMQARAAWMKSMSENLAANKLPAVYKDAEALAEQAKKVGESATNPLAKELHLAVSSLADATAQAAAKNDAAAVKIKLGEIKEKCAECHAKIRDKK